MKWKKLDGDHMNDEYLYFFDEDEIVEMLTEYIEDQTDAELPETEIHRHHITINGLQELVLKLNSICSCPRCSE